MDKSSVEINWWDNVSTETESDVESIYVVSWVKICNCGANAKPDSLLLKDNVFDKSNLGFTIKVLFWFRLEEPINVWIIFNTLNESVGYIVSVESGNLWNNLPLDTYSEESSLSIKFK